MVFSPHFGNIWLISPLFHYFTKNIPLVDFPTERRGEILAQSALLIDPISKFFSNNNARPKERELKIQQNRKFDQRKNRVEDLSNCIYGPSCTTRRPDDLDYFDTQTKRQVAYQATEIESQTERKIHSCRFLTRTLYTHLVNQLAKFVQTTEMLPYIRKFFQVRYQKLANKNGIPFRYNKHSKKKPSKITSRYILIEHKRVSLQ